MYMGMRVHPTIGVWRSEDSLRCFSVSSTLFGSLLVVHSFQGFSCFHTHLAVGEWGLQMCTTVLGLHGSGDSNQGSHASSLRTISPALFSFLFCQTFAVV